MENKHLMADLPKTCIVAVFPMNPILYDDESLQLQVVRVPSSTKLSS